MLIIMQVLRYFNPGSSTGNYSSHNLNVSTANCSQFPVYRGSPSQVRIFSPGTSIATGTHLHSFNKKPKSILWESQCVQQL